MRVIDVIQTANRNLLRSKLRTFLTVSAIFVGAFTLTLTIALGNGAQSYLNRQLGNVSAPGVFYVTPKVDQSLFTNSTEPKEYDPNKKHSAGYQTGGGITMADVEALKKIEGVESARPYRTAATEYITRGQNNKRFVVSTLNLYSSLNLDLAAGRLLQKDDKQATILPDNYLEPLGFSSANDAIDKTIYIGYKDMSSQVQERKLTVVGVMKKSLVSEGEFYVDDTSLEEIAKSQGQGNANDRFFAAIVKFKDEAPTKETEQKNALQKSGNFSALSLKEQVATINNVVSAITTALSLVGIIALFAASFGIINTLLMSVYERTQEIGLMKALGMHRRNVFMLFAIEAVAVGFWGSAIAVGVAYLVSLAVNQWASTTFLKDFEGFQLLALIPISALQVIGLIMLIAFLAGTLPAIKASRLNPIDALRNE